MRTLTGHGTFVAGLIAATIDNAEGVAGMAPSAELLIAKVVDEAARSTSSRKRARSAGRSTRGLA